MKLLVKVYLPIFLEIFLLFRITIKSSENKNDMLIVPKQRQAPGVGLHRAGGLGARPPKPDPSHTKEAPANPVFFQ
jgi:hypothetical protein